MRFSCGVTTALLLASVSCADPIHDAARDGDVAELKKLLDKDPDLVRSPDPTLGPDSTPLHVAARWGQTEIVEALLDYKADVNAEARRCGTPLHLAVRCGHKDLAELLLSRGAQLDIFAAAGLGRLDDVKRLLKDDPKRLNARDSGGDTPLHWAAATGQKAVAELLLERGAEASAKGCRDNTPLHCAIHYNALDLAALLLDHQADIDAVCDAGYAPLHDAVANHNVAAAKFLIARGADVNSCKAGQAPPGVRRTPLHVAAEIGYADLIALLAPKADLDARDEEGGTALHSAVRAAASAGQKDAVRALLRAGARTEAHDSRGRTPLHAAVEAGKADVVELLLDNGADVNATDGDEWTPLHYAVNRRDKATAELLLKRQANVNAAARHRTVDAAGVVTVDPDGGTTPLHVAVSKRSTELAELLLSHKADVNAKDQGGCTALTDAVANDDADMVKLLRKHGGKQ
jgi:ankyrin repeat protein